MQIRCCNGQDMIHGNMRVGDVVYVLDQQKIYMVVEDGFLETKAKMSSNIGWLDMNRISR